MPYTDAVIWKNRKQRYTLGIVYEPEVVDSQDDWSDATEIEKACWNFMRKLAGRTKVNKMALDLLGSVVSALQKGETVQLDVTEVWDELAKGDALINDMHLDTDWEDAPDIVECYIAPMDMEIGSQQVRKGTWLMGVVWPPAYFEKIEAGERTGYSMEGRGRRVERNAP